MMRYGSKYLLPDKILCFHWREVIGSPLLVNITIAEHSPQLFPLFVNISIAKDSPQLLEVRFTVSVIDCYSFYSAEMSP